MRFQVIYDNKFFSGEGSVFMYDTALVFEGSQTKFTIPFIQSFYQLLLIKTIRTVPYSTILKYKKPRYPYNGSHKIIYRLPNGKKGEIVFHITGRDEEDIYFTNKLEEYLTVISSFSGN
ncbi:hypothetical protein [Nostoc sp. CCY 9925]|uniref:hypothetical protein n=1 Tax=Nostoc sp. CCY 9925 TaxID=3103865 RepID=UPI0039C65D99